MAGAKGIRAGKAFVELFADDSKLVRGLKRAQARLRAFSASVTAMGKKLLFGSAIVGAALGAMVKTFLTAGDMLDKMSMRTGVSVEMLSKLGFAAEQSGADVQTLERGLGAMGRFMLDLQLGTKTATDLLGVMGISMRDLAKKTPDQRIKLLLQALAGIEDPSIRAGVAMKVLGRAGRQLLPMAENFDKLSKTAEKFDIVISQKDATLAAELTDSLNLLKQVLKTIAIQIGSALAPMLIKAANWLAEVTSKVISWVKRNKQMIVTIAKIVVVVAAVGVGLIAMGAAAAVTALAIGSVVTIISALAAVGAAIGSALAPLLHSDRNCNCSDHWIVGFDRVALH